MAGFRGLSELMKLSGIDGVIVDWYGIADFRDYAVLNESTGRLFEHIKRAGLLFCICYEDQTIRHMINEGYLAEEDVLAHGQEVMRYLQSHWFDDPAYLRIADQPALFTFGPQYFRDPANWETLFSVLDTSPVLITLPRQVSGPATATWIAGTGRPSGTRWNWRWRNLPALSS